MNIAIVDDEPIFLEIIQNNLQDIVNENIETYSFTSVKDMERTDTIFDFILLDIDMPDCDGIQYSIHHRDVKIVFITSHSSRMKDAFGSNVYGFIEKDDSKEMFCQKMRMVIQEISHMRTIDIKTDIGIYHFQVDDIVYGQYLSNRQISFIVRQKSYIYKGKSLQEFMMMLGDGFYLIDRNTFVNMKHVIGVVNNQVILRDIHQRFTMSARRQTEIKNIFLKRK